MPGRGDAAREPECERVCTSMGDTRAEIYATRGDQLFLRFNDDEIGRLARFGQPRSYRAGDMLARTGEPGPGLILILSGRVEVTQTHGGQKKQIVIHEPGNFLGELAQLSGRPYLVDEQALTDVEAVTIAPDRLRALLVAEADL